LPLDFRLSTFDFRLSTLDLIRMMPDEPLEIPVDGVLDLHTFQPREVAGVVDAYLAACRERGIRNVRIIHGKGTGTLRATVHALLRRHPAVRTFSAAPESAGAWGATLVRLHGAADPDAATVSSPGAPDPPPAGLRRLDGHVHLIGDGSAGSGCSLRLDSLARRLQARLLLASAGLPARLLRGGLDHAYADHLLACLDDSGLDGMVLLAHDRPHDEQGAPLPDNVVFHVPDAAVFTVAARAPGRIVPAVSIHPARADALAALEAGRAHGARVLKLLPNVHNVDPGLPRYRAFWRRCAELGYVFLAHTGGELSLPVLRPELENPACLAPVLEAGVPVIAAHCGSASLPGGRDHLGDWLRLLPRYPHLYGDLSGMCTPFRSRAFRRLRGEAPPERLVYGSDFPIPAGVAGPWLHRCLGTAAALRLRRIRNPLRRSAEIIRAMGFPETVFTRLDQLI
jgi:predicted TIM-barrel fold metal-dependent hydrolase